MAFVFKDRQPHPSTAAAREPLVDIDPAATPPDEPEAQLGLRRKRLSDVQTRTDDPEPGPKPRRKRLSVAPPTAPEESTTESKSTSRRPRISLRSNVAVLDAPEDLGENPRADQGSAPAEADPVAPTQPRADTAGVDEWIAELRARQSLPFAVLGGLLATVVGALVWAVITVVTSIQISWMAIGVGFLVGGIVRALGRGLDKRFGYLGAGLSLFSCILGNFLANCMFIAREVQLPMASVLTQINPAAIPRLMMATFHPLDILFYGLALYLGYYCSFRRITEAQISRAMGKA